MRAVLRSRSEAKLKHDKTKDGDCTVTIFRTSVRPKQISEGFKFEWDLHPPKKKNEKRTYIFEFKTEC